MKSIFARIQTFFIAIAALALGLIAFFVAFSAIMRYVAGSPFGFTEEVVGLLYASLVMLAIGYCAAFNREIKVELLYDALPSALQRAGRLVSHAAVLVFSLWFGVLALDFIEVSQRVGAKTDVTRLTLWPWMGLFLVMAAGLVLAVFLARPDTSRTGVDEGSPSP